MAIEGRAEKVDSIDDVRWEFISRHKAYTVHAGGAKYAGKNEYWIRGVRKRWTYPTYAIEKAVKFLGGPNEVTRVLATYTQKYQLHNIEKTLRRKIDWTFVDSNPRPRKVVDREYPPLKLPPGTRGKTYAPIKIRGDVYVHYAVGGKAAIDIQKKKLQAEGFKVLVRDYGGHKRVHLYKGPRRKKR